MALRLRSSGAPKRSSEARGTRTLRASLGRAVRKPIGFASLFILAIIIAAALLAPVISPFDPLIMSRGQELAPPSPQHLFGADEFGRDLFSRTLFGLRVSLLAGMLSTMASSVVGSTLGLISGYTGGKIDSIIMRCVDGLFAFPPILLAIALLAVLGPGLQNVTLVIAVVQIPTFARLARAATLAERNCEYVMAAQVIGCSPARVLFRHILSNALSPLVVQAAFAMSFSVLIEASLSFVGVGIKPPDPSLGSILYYSQSKMRHALWYPLIPGAILSLLLFSLNGTADVLNSLSTPQKRA